MVLLIGPKDMNAFARLCATLGFVLGTASPVAACPFCGSSTAEQVRAGIFNSDFGYHLGVALAPFLILIAVLLLIYYWTAAGLALLWRAALRRDIPLSTKTLVGAMILGWGLFNLVEGIIDHHILHIRHVTETDNHLIWDLAFLASGVVMIVVGWLVIGRRRDDGSTQSL